MKRKQSLEEDNKFFLFDSYDFFFDSKRNFLFKEDEEDNLNNSSSFEKDLILEKEKIPYFDMEPHYFNINFKETYNINFFHYILRIKYSIIFYNENQSKCILKIWKKYIIFLKENKIVEKYSLNKITSKDCINYLNYVKNNMLQFLEYNKIDSDEEEKCNNNDKNSGLSYILKKICQNCLSENLIERSDEIICNNCGIVIEKLFSINNVEKKEVLEDEDDFENILKTKKLVEYKGVYHKNNNDHKIEEDNHLSSSISQDLKIEDEKKYIKEKNEILKSIDINNFAKLLDYLEGKQKTKISKEILLKMENYLDKNKDKYLGGKSCQQLRELENNEQRRKYTDIFVIEKIFLKFKEKNYKKDIYYIANYLFGWTLLDLSSCKEKLIDMYVEVQKIYNTIKTRESNININMRLLFQLSLLGILLDKKDVKIIKSKDSIEYHINIFAKIAKILDLDISLFLTYFSLS